MVVNKILIAALMALAIIAGVLLWRLNVITDDYQKANERIGQLEQSNNQYAADLNAEREKMTDLTSAVQFEQDLVAGLVKDLEQQKQINQQRKKVIYETASQSECDLSLPDELIRLRQQRTTAPVKTEIIYRYPPEALTVDCLVPHSKGPVIPNWPSITTT
ncbi:hypothetical protein QYZ44_26870 [Vibrio parahaemolyticus]|nr:hypothetical protein [Vibrio parahaemolyticus]MDN4712340.1 hypothetical protein [Vibrio parahaemolyticus]